MAILANDPDHGGAGIDIIQRAQMIAQVTNDALISVGILPENVLDDNYDLLDYKLSGDFCSNQLL